MNAEVIIGLVVIVAIVVLVACATCSLVSDGCECRQYRIETQGKVYQCDSYQWNGEFLYLKECGCASKDYEILMYSTVAVEFTLNDCD